jgi:phospholipid/cholesterol/gamma-HCH transport system ATP-binding protein
MKAFLEINDLHKAFGSRRVLDGVSLSVARGESLVIIGGSGTGKSVLLKCVLGLMKPDSGSIRLEGEEITRLSARRREAVMRRFGMLFQGGALFDSLRVWQNITFAARRDRNLSAREARALAIQKLASVGLGAETADALPASLSGGMQKRVALARAICADPDILFFDEPTTGLDPIMSDVINDLILATTGRDGRTALTITHDMASASKIANRIAMLHRGKIVWEGRAQEIYHSKNAYVDQFVHGRAEGPITTEAASRA